MRRLRKDFPQKLSELWHLPTWICSQRFEGFSITQSQHFVLIFLFLKKERFGAFFVLNEANNTFYLMWSKDFTSYSFVDLRLLFTTIIISSSHSFASLFHLALLLLHLLLPPFTFSSSSTSGSLSVYAFSPSSCSFFSPRLLTSILLLPLKLCNLGGGVEKGRRCGGE